MDHEWSFMNDHDGSIFLSGKIWELWDQAKFRPGPRSEDLELAQTANWIPPEEISMRKMEHRMARFALPGQPNELVWSVPPASSRLPLWISLELDKTGENRFLAVRNLEVQMAWTVKATPVPERSWELFAVFTCLCCMCSGDYIGCCIPFFASHTSTDPAFVFLYFTPCTDCPLLVQKYGSRWPHEIVGLALWLMRLSTRAEGTSGAHHVVRNWGGSEIARHSSMHLSSALQILNCTCSLIYIHSDVPSASLCESCRSPHKKS